MVEERINGLPAVLSLFSFPNVYFRPCSYCWCNGSAKCYRCACVWSGIPCSHCFPIEGEWCHNTVLLGTSVTQSCLGQHIPPPSRLYPQSASYSMSYSHCNLVAQPPLLLLLSLPNPAITLISPPLGLSLTPIFPLSTMSLRVPVAPALPLWVLLPPLQFLTHLIPPFGFTCSYYQSASSLALPLVIVFAGEIFSSRSIPTFFIEIIVNFSHFDLMQFSVYLAGPTPLQTLIQF